jgi:predicted HicB family RNase H-like nuclease
MNTDDDRTFEQHARELLDESVTRTSGRVRSRLNQARHAALAEIAARPA